MLLDRLLDGEVDETQVEAVLARIRADEQASARLDSACRMLSALRQADRCLDAPDLTGRILGRVAARKGLFSRGGVRRLAEYRSAAAAILLAVIAGLYGMQRAAPDALRLSDQPQPVGRIVRAMPTGTADLWSGVRGVMASLRDAVPAAGPTPACLRRIIESNNERALPWVPTVNPPIAAVLWTDLDRTSGTCGGVCRSGRGVGGCGESAERWAAESASPAATLLERPGRRRADSDVLLISFNR